MTIKFNIKVILIIVSFSFLSSDYSVQAHLVSPDDGLIIILDNSGSMREVSEGGDTNINVAKEVINKAMNNRDFDLINIGLLEMGGKCEVKELVSPGLNNRQAIRQASNNIRSYPYLDSATPIAESIYTASKMLQKYKGDKQIILVSDGGANCQGQGGFPLSACDMVASLKNQGIDFSLTLIGYRVENNQQFQCLKELSNDKIIYSPVDTPKGLFSEININVFKTKTFLEQLTEFLSSIQELIVVIIAIIFLILGFVTGDENSKDDSNNVERDNIKKW